MGLLARRGCLRHIKMAATAKAFVCTYNKCACLPRTQRKQQQRKHCCGVNKHASLWDLERRTVVVSKKTYCCRVCMLRASKREKNTSAESSKQRTESSTEFAAGKEKQHNCPTCARQRKKAVNACISCYILRQANNCQYSSTYQPNVRGALLGELGLRQLVNT